MNIRISVEQAEAYDTTVTKPLPSSSVPAPFTEAHNFTVSGKGITDPCATTTIQYT